MTGYTKQYKHFKVTFVEQKKYYPATRTVEVLADDELHARRLVAEEFDTFTFNKKLRMRVPSEKRIKIKKVKEVKNKSK